MSQGLPKELPLSALVDSPFQPRGREADEDLVQSIREHGVLQPILARPRLDAPGAEAWEIVFGHRRCDGSRKAGLSTVPGVVRQMSDQEVLEAQLIENVQRKDMHPVEEAEGLMRLHRDHKLSVEDLAAKIGRSQAYVYQRMKLFALCDLAKDAVRAGKMTVSVAQLVARLPGQVQAQATKRLLSQAHIETTGQARDYLEREYMTDLGVAPWKLDDGELVPTAGSCVACPKRTGNQPLLFPELGDKGANHCTDPGCYKAKMDAHWTRIAAEKRTLPKKELKKLFPYGGDNPSTYNTGYVSLGSTCPEDPRHRTYRQLLGKTAREAELLARAPSGKPVAVIEKKDVKRLLKAAGHDFTKPRSPAATAPASPKRKGPASWEIDEKVGELLKAKVMEFELAGDGGLDAFERSMAYVGLDLLYDFKAAAKVLGIPVEEEKPGKKAGVVERHARLRKEITERLAQASPEQARAIALLGNLQEAVYSPSVAKDVAREYGIDLKALERQARAELTPPPEPKAPAAKKATKKAGGARVAGKRVTRK